MSRLLILTMLLLVSDIATDAIVDWQFANAELMVELYADDGRAL